MRGFLVLYGLFIVSMLITAVQTGSWFPIVALIGGTFVFGAVYNYLTGS